jgi:hypothetical protein
MTAGALDGVGVGLVLNTQDKAGGWRTGDPPRRASRRWRILLAR